MEKELEDRKLAELMNSIRHYSTLRFAMLIVYFAVTGGLLVKFFDCDFSVRYPELHGLFQIAGSMVTVAFFIFEVALDDNLRKLWGSVKKLAGEGDVLLSHRQLWKGCLVPMATYGIFVGVLIFWLFTSRNYYPCQAAAHKAVQSETVISKECRK